MIQREHALQSIQQDVDLLVEKGIYPAADLPGHTVEMWLIIIEDAVDAAKGDIVVLDRFSAMRHISTIGALCVLALEAIVTYEQAPDGEKNQQ